MRLIRATATDFGGWSYPKTGFHFSGLRLAPQHIHHPARELVEAERLADQLDAGIEHAVVDDRIARVTGREQDLERRPPLLGLFGEPAPVHVRHHDVGE